MQELDKVIILKHSDNQEKNRLLTLFGLDCGIFNALARGIRGKNAKLKFLNLPFVFCEVQFLKREGVPIVKTASIIESFSGISKNIERFESACACVQACMTTLIKNHSEPPIFKMLLETLIKIEADEVNPWRHAIYFVIGILSFAGYSLSFEKCAACGRNINNESLFLNELGGELLCNKCAGTNAQQIKKSTTLALKNIMQGGNDIISQETIECCKKFINALFISVYEKPVIIT